MQLNNKKIHELKCWPEFFVPLREQIKEFELRKNDRDYKVGDYLILLEFDPGSEHGHTGRVVYRQVQYVLSASQAPAGLADDYVILGLTRISRQEEVGIDTEIAKARV